MTIRLIPGAWENRDRPTPGQTEDRNVPAESVRVDGRVVHGLIPYNVESRDLGGFTELIEPGALRGARLDDLVALVDHQGVPLGRYPGTLTVEDRNDGLHWSVELPETRSDIREAIQRGDLQAGSWRMRVSRDEWRGDVRHVHEIAELADVSIVTRPAYGNGARVELRSEPGARSDDHPGDRRPSAGSLHVDDRRASSGLPDGLAGAFRSRGFPAETATLDFSEYESRALVWSGAIGSLSRDRRQGEPLAFDNRWLWPVLVSVSVDEGTTSVDVPYQSARTLASGGDMVRDIAATTRKPETDSAVDIRSVALKQVATISSGIPSVYLEQPGFDSIIEADLRLALNAALDGLALAAVAASGFQPPGSDNLYVSLRKAITTLRNAGYNPDTLVLTPAADELLDTMVSGLSGGTADFINGPGQPAGSVWRLSRRVSKGAAAPIVMDSRAFGRLYSSRVSLSRFEENDGATNTQLVRLECHAAVGVERQGAAIRVAAS